MKFFTSKIGYVVVSLVFVLFGSLFLLPNKAEAACEVLLNETFRFRVANSPVNQALPDGWFVENSGQFVYIDFKTSGDCVSGNMFYLTVFGIDEDGDIAKTIENQAIDAIGVQNNEGVAIAMTPDEGPCYDDNEDNSTVECLVFAMITDLPTSNPESKILGLLGDLIKWIPIDQSATFVQQFGGQSLPQTIDCDSSSGYLYITSSACGSDASNTFQGLFSTSTPQKLANYYNTYGGSYTIDIFSEGAGPYASVAFPAFMYTCDGICAFNDEWSVISTTLPYGGMHSTDAGPVPVTYLADIYQEDYVPLAPLPFEGLNGGPTPTLGEYLASIFRMGLVVVVILAVLMIVFHGIALATTGAITKKTEHKEGVWNAILGLLLAMGSWLLLNTINPNLASNLSINIPNVTLEGDAESISTSPVNTSSGTITGLTLPSDMGLYCPLGGGASAVPSIIDSFDNKVTYRWGGKGSDLPSGSSFPLSPNESNNGQYMCTDNGQSVPCRNFCPDNSVCLDCSGFVNHVRKCAGLSIYSGTSSMTQSQDAISVDMSTLSSNGQTLTVNGSPYTLQAGDILVWNGHVVVYYGNGIIAESKGDISSIKNPNQNIKKTNLAQSSYRNKITHLIKVNP